jgi:hypothetical protein
MIVTLRTKQYVIIAALLAATATTAAAYLVVQVQTQATILEMDLQKIAEGNARSAAAEVINRQIAATKVERETVAAAFLGSLDEGGGSFPTALETLAAEMGLTLTILSISDESSQSAAGKQEVKTVFSFTGSERAVSAFTIMLESLPYHARLERLTINFDEAANTAKAEAELRVTVYPPL